MATRAEGPDIAVSNVASRAERNRQNAQHRLASLGVSPEQTARLVDTIRAKGRLTLNFHPDRLASNDRTVAAGLLADGKYRSQFETGISNGGRTAVPDGDRTRWETYLFGEAYGHDSSPRPVYGALDLFDDPMGGSPRFGSSFVVLETSCIERATFTVGDSHLGQEDLGTIDQMTSVLAGAAEECATGGGFGRDLSVAKLFDTAASADDQERSARELDHYIEAQVHGAIELSEDVSAIHLDPSFDGTTVHTDLVMASSRFGFELTWSEGSEVAPDEIDPGFRGPEVVALAHQTTRGDGLVDAATIGRALIHLPFMPPPPGGDAEDSALQRYKKLWHCCLKFGTAPKPLS